MTRYIFIKLLRSFLTLWIVVTAVFFVLRASGDPIYSVPMPPGFKPPVQRGWLGQKLNDWGLAGEWLVSAAMFYIIFILFVAVFGFLFQPYLSAPAIQWPAAARGNRTRPD